MVRHGAARLPPGARTGWREEDRDPPLWGARRVILGDLSPAATFIAANYNIPFDVAAFHAAALQLLKEVEGEIGWMYETRHTDGRTIGRINYTVWSEVFSCPDCTGEVVFIEEALDKVTRRTRSSFPCPHCAVKLTKDNLVRSFETLADPASGQPWKRIRLRPVLIDYSVGMRATRRNRTPPISMSSAASPLSRCRPRFRPTLSPSTRCTTDRASRRRGSRTCTTCSCRGRRMRWRRCGGVSMLAASIG